MRYQGNVRLEIVRKVVHIIVGVLIVLLFQSGILDLATFGLLILLYCALILFNLKYERELITKVVSINRADRDVPGLDVLFYFAGCWVVLALFHTPATRPIAFAAIMILAFADPVAHVISRSFGAIETFITKTTYLEGTIAGIFAGTLAAWIYVPVWAALIASAVAMVVEAGELRVGSHHVDDNLTIPVVAGVVLWVISLAIPLA